MSTPPSIRPPRRRQDRGEATTQQLVFAARDLFASEGFAGTSLDAVVAACGVTKGALYHHFAGKAELFEAVFEAEERSVCAMTVEAYGRKRDPLDGLLAGCKAFLEATLDPGVQRIMLLDGPSVLGWQRVREYQARYGLALLKSGLAAAMKAGRLPRGDVDPLGHLLFGALCEGAMLVAGATDQRKALGQVDKQLRALVAALAT